MEKIHVLSRTYSNYASFRHENDREVWDVTVKYALSSFLKNRGSQ